MYGVFLRMIVNQKSLSPSLPVTHLTLCRLLFLHQNQKVEKRKGELQKGIWHVVWIRKAPPSVFT